MYYFIFSMLVFLILMLIYYINYYVSKVNKMNYSKLTPFECGFTYVSTPNMPFSLSHFLVNLMFLIFDVEIVMMLPLIMNLNRFSSMIFLFTIALFMIVLILTMAVELSFNLLEWTS